MNRALNTHHTRTAQCVSGALVYRFRDVWSQYQKTFISWCAYCHLYQGQPLEELKVESSRSNSSIQCTALLDTCTTRIPILEKYYYSIKAGLHRNTNTNAACENDAYVHVGKFVDCSAFAEAANRLYINVLYANSL